MPATRPDQPPRFVVQCAKGKGWKTLVVDDSQPAAERAFREVVKINPRGFFRLIRLDDRPDAEIEGQEFSWKLLHLHDPRKSGVNARPAAGGRPAKSQNKMRWPLRLYGLAILLGLLLALLAYLVYGPALNGGGVR